MSQPAQRSDVALAATLATIATLLCFAATTKKQAELTTPQKDTAHLMAHLDVIENKLQILYENIPSTEIECSFVDITWKPGCDLHWRTFSLLSTDKSTGTYKLVAVPTTNATPPFTNVIFVPISNILYLEKNSE